MCQLGLKRCQNDRNKKQYETPMQDPSANNQLRTVQEHRMTQMASEEAIWVLHTWLFVHAFSIGSGIGSTWTTLGSGSFKNIRIQFLWWKHMLACSCLVRSLRPNKNTISSGCDDDIDGEIACSHPDLQSWNDVDTKPSLSSLLLSLILSNQSKVS